MEGTRQDRTVMGRGIWCVRVSRITHFLDVIHCSPVHLRHQPVDGTFLATPKAVRESCLPKVKVTGQVASLWLETRDLRSLSLSISLSLNNCLSLSNSFSLSNCLSITLSLSLSLPQTSSLLQSSKQWASYCCPWASPLSLPNPYFTRSISEIRL